MRESGVRGVLIYCSDRHCSHHIAAGADPWPDQLGCPILSPVLSAQLAAGVALISGRVFTGISRAWSPEVFDRRNQTTSFAQTKRRNRNNIPRPSYVGHSKARPPKSLWGGNQWPRRRPLGPFLCQANSQFPLPCETSRLGCAGSSLICLPGVLTRGF